MTAVTFTKPGYPPQDVIKLSTFEVPSLNEEEVLVQIKAVALNPVDIQVANLFFFRWINTHTAKILGRDYSGVVLETGNNSQFQKGQEVFGMVFDPNFIKGTLASHIVVNPFEQIILPKPSTFNFREAAAVPLVWITGYTALIDYGRLVPDPTQGQGKTVAVIGASGGTGLYGLQIAKRICGVEQVVAVCSSKNEELVKSRGADVVVAYDQEDVSKRLVELGPFDALYDCLGGVELLPYLGKLCKPEGGGWVSIVGEKHDRSVVGGAITNYWSIGQLYRYYLGRFGFGPRYNVINLTPKTEYLQKAVELHAMGKLEVDIDSIYPFNQNDIHEAFSRLDTGRARGKILIEM